MRYSLIGAATVGLCLIAGQGVAGSFTFTTTSDWNTGVFASTNAGPPGFDQVQLNPNVVTTFNHIWVAASGRGTVIRIDTNTGTVLGEYYTAPNGRGRDPSRTTVDQNGDVWVGNRAETSGGQGSVAKISASATGPNTSTGVWNAPTGAAGTFDARPWTNAGNVDSDGGTDTAQDVAILQYVRTPGTANRTIAVDKNNDVWVGGYNNGVHQQIDGDTGALIGAPFTMSPGGYGGLIDSQGVLYSSGWSSAVITRYDTGTVSGARGPLPALSSGGSSYGLAIDSNGFIWNSHLGSTVSKINPATNTREDFNAGGWGGRGVAVTPDDNIWIANSSSNTVTRLSNTGALLATINVGSTPTGVAVDSNGKVWVTNYGSSTVMRIDPNGGASGLGAVDLTVNLGPNANPYNYSDMTGSVIGGITNPTGTWTAVIDAGKSGTKWDKVFWNTEAGGAIPVGTSITIQARAANALGDLAGLAWQSFASGASLGLIGQFAEVRAILTRTGTGPDAPSPILSDLRLTTMADGPAPIPLPASWLLLATAGAGLLKLKKRRAA